LAESIILWSPSLMISMEMTKVTRQMTTMTMKRMH